MKTLSLIKFTLIAVILTTFAFAKTNFVIVHTNDTHGRLLETKEVIGFAKIATYVDDLKKEKKYVLYLDAGDTLHGTSLVNLSKGAPVIEIFNKMNIDAMALGNHDFNYGLKVLRKNIKKADFAMIAANVVLKKNGKPITKTHIVKKLNKEVTVGVFGLATPETAYKTHPKNVEELEFKDVVATAKEQVAELKRKGANFIVAVVHLGIDESTAENERSTILAEVDGLDLVVDGHSHTKLPNGKIVKNLVITQTGEYDNNLGYIDITIDDNKKTITPSLLEKSFFKDIKEDKKVTKIINKYKTKQNQYLSKKVASLNFNLDGDRSLVRTQPTNFGTLIATSIKNDLKVDVAFVNGGSIRESIPAGDVTVKDILTALPFGNNAVAVEITGKTLMQVIEKSVANIPNSFGGHLHFAGVSFTVNTKGKTNTLSNVVVAGKPIDVNATYTVATMDFLTAGGDGYSMLKGAKVVASSDAIDQIVVRFLQNNPNLTNKDLATKIKIIK